MGLETQMCYTTVMSERQQVRLLKAYKKYRALKKKNVSGFLRVFMPEIIFRTTKLEDERVNRKMISSLFN